MKKRQANPIFYILAGLIVLIAMAWYATVLTGGANPPLAENTNLGVGPQSNSGTTPVNRVENTAGSDLARQPSTELPPRVLIANVPFTSQAPSGQWDDPRQQDACEEASILMIAKWRSGESIGSTTDAIAQILSLSALADTVLGTHIDSSAADTLKLFRAYTGTTDGVLTYDVTLTDIKRALAAGNLVMAPMNGQALNNPNFTGGGPERHFLVIIGYDDITGMFTTNDPGTRRGQNYRYTYATLFAAMRDYPTGDHQPITSNRRAMISVSKS